MKFDKTTPGQNADVAFEFDLKHSPKKVWRALTDARLLTEWLLPITQLKLEENAAFTFQAPPQPGWDGVVNCQYQAIEPEKKLSWSWVVGEIDTVVTFTLTPTDAGTRLSLLQTGADGRTLSLIEDFWKLLCLI